MEALNGYAFPLCALTVVIAVFFGVFLRETPVLFSKTRDQIPPGAIPLQLNTSEEFLASILVPSLLPSSFHFPGFAVTSDPSESSQRPGTFPPSLPLIPEWMSQLRYHYLGSKEHVIEILSRRRNSTGLEEMSIQQLTDQLFDTFDGISFARDPRPVTTLGVSGLEVFFPSLQHRGSCFLLSQNPLSAKLLEVKEAMLRFLLLLDDLRDQALTQPLEVKFHFQGSHSSRDHDDQEIFMFFGNSD